MIGAPARDRVAIPLKTGIVAAVVAWLILALAVVFIGLPAFAILVALLGYAPSMDAGQPFGESVGIIAYSVMAWYAWRRLGSARSPMPLHVPSRVEVLIFLGALVAILVVDHVSDAILYAVGQGDHVQAGFENFSVAMNTAAGTALAIALTALGGVAVGPFAEELAVRGLLFGGLTSRIGVVPAAILSGVIFGALHGDPVYFAVIAVEGFIFALAYAATGNLLVPIALHASMNAIAFWPTLAETLLRR